MRWLVLFCALAYGAPVLAEISSTRPMPRPAGIETSARNPANGVLGQLFGSGKSTKKAPAVKGFVCEDPEILGTAVASIRGKQKGCGVENPVKITSVAGVRLSTPATLDCNTARALRKWVSDRVKPAFGKSGIAEFQVAAHYACRPRNNKKGARISEHGRGKAIDISGFTLANGTRLSVLKHYRGSKGSAMRNAYKGACGIFGTTLGPGSDGYHEDNLHFDTAGYRGGPYCR